MPTFESFGYLEKRPIFGHTERKNHGLTYTNVVSYMFYVDSKTNIHDSEEYIWTYNIGRTLRNSCMLGFNNKKLDMTGSYMLGFGRLRQINMNGYYEQNSVYKQNIASLDELLFNIKILWGIRFVEHCLCLNGGGHKVVPLIGIKERPPDY